MPFDAPRYEDNSVLQILIGARALIDTPDKWVQGHGHHGNRRCLMFALHDARFGERSYLGPQLDALDGPYAAALSVVGRAVGFPFCIPAWNDWSGTTHADVLRILDQAIAAERAHPTVLA